jgi:hypothetical protein
MKGEYLHAAEQQLAWRRYMLERGAANWGRDLPAEGAGFGVDPAWSDIENYYVTQRAAFGAPIFKGELFYVGPEFCDVLQRAVDALNYDVTLEASWFPVPIGFVYFSRALELPPLQEAPDFKATFQAIGWSCLKLGEQVAEHTYQPITPNDPGETEQAVFATMRTGMPGWPFFPLSFLSWKVNKSLNETITDKEAKWDDKGRYGSDRQRHELRYAAVLLLLLQQRFLVQRTLALEWDRGARRRHEREEVTAPDNIKVITFRKEIYASAHTTTRHNREYAYRFAVRGHWRQQWYPSKQIHQPKYILPFVKGQAGKPFKGAERIFAVVR